MPDAKERAEAPDAMAGSLHDASVTPTRAMRRAAHPA
jgi:hypothetical protein